VGIGRTVPTVILRGVLEGFYGRPWTWDERIAVSQLCAARGMTHYVYAPKDDPKQRHEWRVPYTEDELAQFRRIATEGGLTLGCAVSPGLSIDYGSAHDRALLMAKIESLVDAGAGLIALQFDDIPIREGLGREHGEITAWVHQHLAGRAELAMCPTEYVGVEPSPYLDALADLVPEEVPIQWTGVLVVNDTITVGDAEARADALGGRKPSLWDNYPVNDGFMVDQLFLGPLRGRPPELLDALDGYMANSLVQPRAGTLPLASIAAWLRGDDHVQAWREEADALGWRTFAEACDGELPNELVGALADEDGGLAWADAAAALATWLKAAKHVTAPGLEDEAGEWLTRVREEASFMLDALRLYQDTKPVARIAADGRGKAVASSEDDALRHGGALAMRWKALRRGTPEVMGPRLGLKVAFGQASTGGFAFRPGVVEEDANAADALAREAFTQAELLGAPGQLVVMADGADVPVADDGSFTVPADTNIVVVRSGAGATRVHVPCEPPLPERRLD
jgi:hypothetical protein